MRMFVKVYAALSAMAVLCSALVWRSVDWISERCWRSEAEYSARGASKSLQAAPALPRVIATVVQRMKRVTLFRAGSGRLRGFALG